MGAPLRFRTINQSLGPSWLTTEGESGLVNYSLDLTRDLYVERLRLGLMARFPQNDPTGQTTAPQDALDAMGRDRICVQGINETKQSYAARLIKWLDEAKTRGTPYALMRKLAEYMGPLPSFRTVDVRGNWFSRAADGTQTALLKQGNWNWDNDKSGKRWSRFWVIIYPNGLWNDTTPPAWGASSYAWGDPTAPGSWGSSAPPDQVQTIRGLVRDWKMGGTRCVNIIIAFDPASFNPASPEPDGHWGSWSKNVGGVQVPSRLATARYWDGV